jgi:hypothetical protein
MTRRTIAGALAAAALAAGAYAVGAARHPEHAAAARTAKVDLWQTYQQVFKRARYIDLTHTIAPTSPVWHGFGPSKFSPTVDPATGRAYTVAKDGFWATHYDLSTDQLGTQLDPPAHWAPRYPSIDELPATYAVRPLVVISIVPQVRKDPKYALHVSDIRAFERRHGRIPAGSVVMVRSDWSKKWTDDPVKAKALAATAGLVPGTKVNLAFNTGGGHEAWVQAVAQQLEKNLGLQIDLQPMPFAELLKREKAPDASGLFRAGWIADYPSAENMLFPLLSKHSLPPGDNRGRYVNERFDDLLAQARKAPSEDQRANLIKEAERIAIGTDLALIPLWYRSVQRVFDADRWADVRLDFFENPTLAVIHRK